MLICALTLSCIGAMLSACREEGQQQPGKPDLPRVAAGAALRDVTFFSNALGREMTYRVFLPEKVAAGQKLPVVYLLHGNGGSFRDWSNYSDVSTYSAQGLILVMPEGGSSYFINAVDRPRDKYEDYLTQDLIADVESRFPGISGRESRAVVGVSMGGFAAVKVGLSHPELYVFAGAISPAIDVPERRFSWMRASQWSRFRSIFGPMGSKERASRDPFALAQSADPRVTPLLYLTAGEQEPLRDPIARFAGRLRQRGFAFEFRTLRGFHDWNQWNAQIPGCFASLLPKLRPSLEQKSNRAAAK
jgi:putative tributyrin esterase